MFYEKKTHQLKPWESTRYMFKELIVIRRFIFQLQDIFLTLSEHPESKYILRHIGILGKTLTVRHITIHFPNNLLPFERLS